MEYLFYLSTAALAEELDLLTAASLTLINTALFYSINAVLVNPRPMHS
jgi:hypothetical protein